MVGAGIVILVLLGIGVGLVEGGWNAPIITAAEPALTEEEVVILSGEAALSVPG